MKRKMAIIGSLIALGGIAILLLGCPPPVVGLRPPEPRVEVYGPPPHPDHVWIPGYWKQRGGEWDWAPGYWAKRPRPHAVWVPGNWEPRRGGWVWHRGHWK